jgi:ABC-2 type transport system ATP-binding protein
MPPQHEAPAIECDALTKRYPGGYVALRELSLRIPRGAAFGLLGENGAGKSTLVRLVMGFIFPSSGAPRQPSCEYGSATGHLTDKAKGGA